MRCWRLAPCRILLLLSCHWMALPQVVLLPPGSQQSCSRCGGPACALSPGPGFLQSQSLMPPPVIKFVVLQNNSYVLISFDIISTKQCHFVIDKKKIIIKPHASLDFWKKSDEKQVFFLEWPKLKLVYNTLICFPLTNDFIDAH